MDAASKENEERGRAIVQTLAVVVESMIQPTDSAAVTYYAKSKFEAYRAPGISIRDYLLRIHKYASCSPECFVLALVYIDRLYSHQGIVLTELNVHRIVITSIVVAAKFFDDHYFNNAYYAKVGGVPCAEMNELEVEFLLMINFSLHVSTDSYITYYNELANHYIRSNNPSVESSIYRPIRHYVVPDPNQDGQLVYVTDVSHELEQQQVEEEPTLAAFNEAGVVCEPQHNHHLANNNGSHAAQCHNASGQKRRSVVALGVNA